MFSGTQSGWPEKEEAAYVNNKIESLKLELSWAAWNA